MLTKIKSFFEEFVRVAETEASPDEKLRIATAALMIEMMQADNHCDPVEEASIRTILTQKLGIKAEELNAIIQLAEAEKNEAVDYYQFTSLLNQHYVMEDKVKVLGYLWEIAYADGHVSAFEEHYLRKIADLLHLPHSQFIRTKLEAEEKSAS